MKRTLLLTMTMLTLLTVSALAYEIDMSYTGAIDIFNGQPIDESADTADTDIVVFDESSYFDRRDGMFVYRVSGAGNEIRCSVADGMMTSDHVRVEVSEGMDCTLYLDGEQIDAFDLSDLSEAGSYAVTAGPSSQDSRTIRFTICASTSSNLEQYWVPDHFYVTEVLCNGEKKTSSTDLVDLTEEGEYQITYYCQPTKIPYYLNMQIDHTAPTVTLNGVVEGVAKGPVTISDVESGTSIYMELNGQQIPYSEELTKNGSYTITVYDEAGNVTTYDFVLLVYFNVNSLVFFAAFLLLGGVLVWYLIRARKHVRVR